MNFLGHEHEIVRERMVERRRDADDVARSGRRPRPEPASPLPLSLAVAAQPAATDVCSEDAA